MAGAAISFAVEKLGDALTNKVSSLIGVEDQVRWVKDELLNMQCFLKDAAEKQGHDEKIRQWISEVREVAHDAEDVIDLFTLKVNAPTKKRDLVGFPRHVSYLNRVGKEIESIRSRLDEIAKRQDRYGIQNLGEVGAESSSRSRSELQLRMAVRLQKDEDVVGLNEDADLLVKKVILDSKKGLSLAAIVGMGGIGKSTLARKIYNHPDMAARFEKRAWVVVSSKFEAEDIMKHIMYELSVPLNADELKTLESIQESLRRQEILQQMLRKRLAGKHYFIVLDDLWENTHWETLQTAFPDEQDHASRLLFTSRNQVITKDRGYIHKMGLLNTDESWELLLKTALMGRTCTQDLEDIGREVSEKCRGLPLAIIMAGGLLAKQGGSKSGWDKILGQMRKYDSKAWGSILPILELSYQNLPSELKLCFLCLAFFKEDEIIRVGRLLHIWVVLGLVNAEEVAREEVAREYLEDLINRNLILVKEVNINNEVKYCYVHDLVRDLSIKIAKEEMGFKSLTSEDHDGDSSSSNKLRHWVVRGTGQRTMWIDSTNKKHLRSLFLEVKDPCSDEQFTSSSNWESFEVLRVLDIESGPIITFPSAICALIGIKYLRLRVGIKYSGLWVAGALELPRSLDNLKNLEVIHIVCQQLHFPVVEQWKFNSLRHFYVYNYHMLPFYDGKRNGVRRLSLENIETLKYIDSSDLVEGKHVYGPRLRKLGIWLYKEPMECLERFLAGTGVHTLHLRADTNFHGELPNLKSMEHLTRVKFIRFWELPPIADKIPQTLTHLKMFKCGISVDGIKELGKLPNLVFLKLESMSSENLIVSNKEFPRLKDLHLTRIDTWSIYVEEGGMAKIQRLEIRECPKLHIENLENRIPPPEIIIINDAYLPEKHNTHCV